MRTFDGKLAYETFFMAFCVLKKQNFCFCSTKNYSKIMFL